MIRDRGVLEVEEIANFCDSQFSDEDGIFDETKHSYDDLWNAGGYVTFSEINADPDEGGNLTHQITSDLHTWIEESSGDIVYEDNWVEAGGFLIRLETVFFFSKTVKGNMSMSTFGLHQILQT